MASEPEQFDPKIKKEIIDSIRYYPSIFKSCMDVLSHMLVVNGAGYEWNDKGEIINVCNGITKDEKPKISNEYAEEIYELGDVSHYCHFSEHYDKGSTLWLIPDNVTKEWRDVIQYFCERVNRIDYKSYKLQTLAYCIRHYRINNPHCYEWFDRSMKDFDVLRKHTDALCEKYGWKWLTVKELHDPKRKKAASKSLSKMIREILNNADRRVPGALQSIQKKEAAEFVRRYGAKVFKEVIEEEEKNKETA